MYYHPVPTEASIHEIKKFCACRPEILSLIENQAQKYLINDQFFFEKSWQRNLERTINTLSTANEKEQRTLSVAGLALPAWWGGDRQDTRRESGSLNTHAVLCRELRTAPPVRTPV